MIIRLNNTNKGENTMKQQLNLTFIDNESHGYIKLSKYDLQGFGIGIKEFSKYSYYHLLF